MALSQNELVKKNNFNFKLKLKLNSNIVNLVELLFYFILIVDSINVVGLIIRPTNFCRPHGPPFLGPWPHLRELSWLGALKNFIIFGLVCLR